MLLERFLGLEISLAVGGCERVGYGLEFPPFGNGVAEYCYGS